MTVPAESPGEPATIGPLAAITEAVRGPLSPDAEMVTTRRLRLLDTVDRRLHRRGWRLEVEPAAGGAGERWRLLNRSGRERAAAEFGGPSFRLVDDLPDGPLYRALEPVVGIRALLPSAWVALVEHRVALRDAEGKIRCCVLAQTATVETSGDRRSAVRVGPLKGYERDARRIADRVARRFGWSPSAPDPLAALSEGLHDEPGGTAYPAVQDLEAPAGLALRPVLRALLDTLEHRARGVIADIDTEELHDLRVAVRRGRSILALLRSSDQVPDLQAATTFFSWLSKVTSPARDLDVHLLDWRSHRRHAPAALARDLEPLGRFLQAERDRAYAEMVGLLQSRDFRRGVRRCRLALAAGEASWSAGTKLAQPIGRLAARRILKLYDRVVREGSAIDPASPDEALHALRKTMKKLRYVLEIVRGGYPQKQAEAVLKRLKELQQELGDVQDTAVQAEALRRYGRIMGESGLAGPPTLMAIGALAEDLEIRRAQARERFAEVFEPVARRKFGNRLRRLTRMGDGG